MEEELRAALDHLEELQQSRDAQLDALQGLVLALLKAHPQPEQAMEHFELQMRLAEAGWLNDGQRSEAAVHDRSHAWSALRDLCASSLAAPALPKVVVTSRKPRRRS